MTKKITHRDWEAISAYIDNELSPKEREIFEARLKTEPELRSLLVDMKRTRTLVRSLEPVRAPRNFTLTPEMAGVRERRFWPVPAFQWASAFATLLFVLVFAGDLLGVLGPQPPSLDTALQVETAPSPAVPEAVPPTLAAALEAEGLAPIEGDLLQAAEEAEPQADGQDFMKAAETPEAPLRTGELAESAPHEAEPTTEIEPPAGAETDETDSEATEGYLGTNLSLRIIEVGLAMLALILALAALVFRRRVI